VIVLTETSKGDGTSQIVRGLRERGLEVIARQPGSDRGALIAVRAESVLDITDNMESSMPWRSPAIQITTQAGPLAVVGVYAPSRDRSNGRAARKQEFLSRLTTSLAALNEKFSGRLLMLGDHNAVARDHSPSHPGFTSWEYQWHADLVDLGLLNVHQLLGVAQPHSWVGRTGNAYLYDYVQLGTALHQHLNRFAYLHAPRLDGLSDHAAVEATLTQPERIGA
jgi:exodeoxyribonuclease-3